jgi:hypothetical protein
MLILLAWLALQTPAAAATMTSSRSLTEPLAFSNPALQLQGTIRPKPGDRLQMVIITVGEQPITAEVRRFRLVSAGGAHYEPIAVGGGADLIFPLDSLPPGRELGQILPSDAIITLMRTSSSSVMLEADAGATLALVFELPQGTLLRCLTLPDGLELAVGR